MMQAASPTASQKVADEVVAALGHLSATAGTDLEAGEAAGTSSATDTLVTAVAKSMISKVDTETSLSLLRRGATYCWGKVRGSMTRQNLTATFGPCSESDRQMRVLYTHAHGQPNHMLRAPRFARLYLTDAPLRCAVCLLWFGDREKWVAVARVPGGGELPQVQQVRDWFTS